jgi:hypothetical protein
MFHTAVCLLSKSVASSKQNFERVEGKVFAPRVDPLHPGDAAPIAQFADEFTAQRVNP